MIDKNLNWTDITPPHKQRDEVNKALSMSIDERNKYLNGEWKPEITWTNCADAMPELNSKDKVIVRKWDHSVIEKTLASNLRCIPYPILWEWIPYKPEIWRELNK